LNRERNRVLGESLDHRIADREGGRVTRQGIGKIPFNRMTLPTVLTKAETFVAAPAAPAMGSFSDNESPTSNWRRV